jgi:hypothetical protein
MAAQKAQMIRDQNEKDKRPRFFDANKHLKYNPVSADNFKIVSPKHRSKLEFKEGSQFK